MRRRYTHFSEPRADGFVVGGLVAVILLTAGAFVASEAFVQDETPGARAYTLSALPAMGGETVAAAEQKVDEIQTSGIQASVAEGEAPLCSVAKCAAAYRSFDANDCTFQPFDGERRICPY